MPFFTKKKQFKISESISNKRKKPLKANKFSKKQKNDYKVKRNDEIISSEDDDFSGNEKQDETYSSEEETQQEKKLRLTKEYLKKIEEEERDKAITLEDAKGSVAHRLKEEALEEAGRLHRKVAENYKSLNPEQLFVLKGHKRSITCLVISHCEKFAFTGGKDFMLIKWSLETGKKLKVIGGPPKKGADPATHIGHTAIILSLAISSDNKFLASGCMSNIINIWNPETMELVKTFKGHKGPISGLTFQRKSHQLISSSSDRSLKLWNLDEMGYVETLFGHQDGVTGIDSFHGETAVTSGGRDNTVRIWKIVEESQLVFQGHGVSIDCVCVSSPKHFVSGADDGSLSLWGVHKKKPLFKLPAVHGKDLESGEPNWILSVCALPNTDLFASGACDGQVRLWQHEDERHTIQPIACLPAKGFANALSFSVSGKLLAVGLGQEHKLGRWWRSKEARNVVIVYKFSPVER